MFSRYIPVSRKRSFQYFKLLHAADIEPSPSGKAATALSADLPREQSSNAFLNSVVVRLDDSFFPLILESNQPLVFDRAIKQLVQSKIDYDSRHLSILPRPRCYQRRIHRFELEFRFIRVGREIRLRGLQEILVIALGEVGLIVGTARFIPQARSLGDYP